jgi:hypothetical protein
MKEIWPSKKIGKTRKMLFTLLMILVPFWGLVVYTSLRDIKKGRKNGIIF